MVPRRPLVGELAAALIVRQNGIYKVAGIGTDWYLTLIERGGELLTCPLSHSCQCCLSIQTEQFNNLHFR